MQFYVKCVNKLNSVTHIWPTGGSEYCCSLEKFRRCCYPHKLRDPCMTLSITPPPPIFPGSTNYFTGGFLLLFRLQTTYRILKNKFIKFISRQFWTFYKFMCNTILSRENPSRKWQHWSERFAVAETSFIRSKTSRISVPPFQMGFLGSGWCKTEDMSRPVWR